MPPNFVDTSTHEIGAAEDSKENVPKSGETSSFAALKAVRSLTTLTTHMLIGTITGVSLLFSFRNGLPIGSTPLHIVLCVLGYQFLMAEAVLCLAPDSWCSTLSLKHKRWIHTWLQIIGSILALVGSFIKTADKTINFNTLHGQYSLAATVFVFASLINGLTSLYAYEFRKCIPGIISKLSHILFGSVAIVMASVSLAYGFDKHGFRAFITDAFSDALIVMTGVYTTIVIINPALTFYTKFKGAVKN